MDLQIVNDDDERLTLRSNGRLSAEVFDAATKRWRLLDSPDLLVGSYDPPDVFADVADALVDTFPGIVEASGS